MKEIKCPNCGKVFSVDDSDFASILSQVKNQAFAEELEARISDMEQRAALAQKNRDMAMLQRHQADMAQRDSVIAERDSEIARLKQHEEAIRQEEQLKHEQSVSQLKVEMERLRAELEKKDATIGMARLEEQNKSKDEIHRRESEIEQLKLQIANEQNDASKREQSLKERYELQLQQAQETVEYYKDMKIRMSTKMVGETLEQHCSTLYNTTLRPFLPNAYFEKDNDNIEGTKGDFVFRDYDGDMEYISIMFEMKNEMDTTATKHKNEDFFAKLDADRRKKGCEYAVLVSMLEADNELYNNGIVDVSYRYDKMYVIRPQFFIPLITILVQSARKTVEYRRKLQLAEQQTIDLSNFMGRIDKFKDSYEKYITAAHKKYSDAIEQIDKSIQALQRVKDSLIGSEAALNKAKQQTDDLTIKKLTWGNKTLRQQLEADGAAE